MNQKFQLAATVIVCLFIYSCGSSPQTPSSTSSSVDSSMIKPEANAGAADSKGTGKFTDVKLTHPLDKKMIAAGISTYDIKCGACHRLTNEKLVGPGWKEVTDRRTPEWIMNFITNTDEMIDKDAAAQAMLEKCMVRMPNQHLKDEEAREVLEFMRQNDGKN
ncbi:Cytochrome c [Chitinophaga sp. CF118]|uniref:c-type cytochrome n=1 Tax=Chitinophaga sp. CF118 TaxID=1884367 RepID=UPI0008EC5D2F|nr:c-type cytochrome [Chitinophaga sp. CF118]SFD47366.1 Cytochrome c [Chitinophaga sp. CF118]